MNAEPMSVSVVELADLSKKGFLKINAEYQRGQVWTLRQKQLLIDSVLRGYPLPKIYLQRISHASDALKLQATHFEVIDGQQRINAITGFLSDRYSLLDPTDPGNRFPTFQRNTPCPWAGKMYSALPESDKKQLNSFTLAIEAIKTEEQNEPRDLFIRLQAGLPLNTQEKRDAWPGGMADFICRVAGKRGLYEGDGFFDFVTASQTRGRNRQLAAQIVLLLLRRLRNESTLADTNSQALDELYHNEIAFDSGGHEAEAIRAIFLQAANLLKTVNLPKLRGHTATHLCLLIQALRGEYARGWEPQLAGVLAKFDEDLAKATKSRQGNFWLEYGQWARTNSDMREAIERRDAFFSAYFLARLKNVTKKDPKRSFTELERRIVFYRDQGLCAKCKEMVAWVDAEVDHIEAHAAGGKTELENARLMHARCHPRGGKVGRESLAAAAP